MMQNVTEGPSLLTRYKGERIFKGTPLFLTFSERLVRKHVLIQFNVESGHPVFDEEERLIQKSVREIKEYLTLTRIEWTVPWRLVKTIFIQYVRSLTAIRVREQDFEDEIVDAVMESIYREDFEGIFPLEWKDS